MLLSSCIGHMSVIICTVIYYGDINMKKVAVIGGGASGLMAALSASELYDTVVFEKNERVGRKLMQTGNGRCNLTNDDITDLHYFGNSFVNGAFSRFSKDDTLRFMMDLGLMAKREYGGRYYAYSGQAGSVVDALRFAATKKAIDIRTGVRVTGIAKNGDVFTVKTSDTEEAFDFVIVCCGGPAAEKLGGSYDGIDILRSFGHSINDPKPALVPLTTDNRYTRMLKGVRVQGKASLKSKSRGVIREAEGDILFTDYGLSGPAIMDVSRFVDIKEDLYVSLDLMPEISEEELISRLERMKDIRDSAGDLLLGLIHNKLSIVMAKYCGIEPSLPTDELTDKDIRKLARVVKGMSFSVKGTTGFANAQTSSGGACTDGFDSLTLESRIVKGLFAAGEVLDVDGECGGFNLQWAWSSGYVAGRCGK